MELEGKLPESNWSGSNVVWIDKSQDAWTLVACLDVIERKAMHYSGIILEGNFSQCNAWEAQWFQWLYVRKGLMNE